MRILFTGASSFTGSWFVRELARRGHEVVATFTREREAYEGLRAERVRQVCEVAEPRFSCAFGSDELEALVRTREWDALCHHAAHVGDYRSPDFDVLGAVAANTRNLARTLQLLAERDCRRVVLTGTYFESGEGSALDDRPAFSRYGLSKTLTAQVVRFEARQAGMALGKLVIPNPFGPWEEPRFTTYLARSWLAGETPRVAAPAYLRDNIHVSLLARAYAAFVEELPADGRFHRLSPSGYRETQGAFAARLARELEPRLGVPCPLELHAQEEFVEPPARVNPDALDAAALGWDEAQAWDELAAWYRDTYGRPA